jgi:hypothetical protein
MERFVKRIPRQLSTWVSIISFGLFASRFLVLFFESWSVVRSERTADAKLLEMCSRGIADESQKFRALCIQARAEQAAPLFLKVILRAIRTAFSDFMETFHSPSRIALLVLFCVSGLALPIVKAASSLVSAHLKPDSFARFAHIKEHCDDDQEACAVVVLEGGSGKRQGALQRLRKLPHRLTRRVTADPTLRYISEVRDEYMEDDGGNAHGWSDIDY